jgi:hypothetical protein
MCGLANLLFIAKKNLRKERRGGKRGGGKIKCVIWPICCLAKKNFRKEGVEAIW